MRGVQEREDEEGRGDESDYSSDENIEQTYCSQLHNNRILNKHLCLKFKKRRGSPVDNRPSSDLLNHFEEKNDTLE